MLSYDPSASPAALSKFKTRVKQSSSVPFSSQPLRVSIKNFLRSVATTKPHAAAPTPVTDPTIVAIRYEDDIQKQDEERLSKNRIPYTDLDSKAEVALFVAGKMYKGKEMRYLGRD